MDDPQVFQMQTQTQQEKKKKEAESIQKGAVINIKTSWTIAYEVVLIFIMLIALGLLIAGSWGGTLLIQSEDITQGGVGVTIIILSSLQFLFAIVILSLFYTEPKFLSFKDLQSSALITTIN